MADYLKKEQKEMINDLVSVFSPMSEKVTKKYVKQIYETCLSMALKKNSYIRTAMSLAKVMAAQHIEEMIKREAGIITDNEVGTETTESAVISESSEAGDFTPVEDPINPAAPEERVKRKFIP